MSEGKKMCVRGCFVISFLYLELCSQCFFFYFYFFYNNFWVCIIGSEFVFLLLLFKTHLDLNSYDF